MSIVDVTARIQQIQSQLGLFAPATSTGTAFSTSLDSASAANAGTTAGGAGAVADASQYLGVPYVWGGTDHKTGLDCSGLVQRVYADLGYTLPRTAAEQATSGTEVPGGMANARPGDVLTFGSPAHHVGIYLGGGQMIDAPHPGTNVRVESVYETPSHVRRILPDQAMTTTTPTTGTPTDARFSATTPYANLFTAAAAKYDVPATLLAAVAKQESGYNPAAVSPAGAEGLMQLMPGTARGLGVTNPFDPAQAVDGAARMLRDLTNRFGRTDLAVAAYNAGPGAVLRYDGIPPYPETQAYVRNVMSEMTAAS